MTIPLFNRDITNCVTSGIRLSAIFSSAFISLIEHPFKAKSRHSRIFHFALSRPRDCPVIPLHHRSDLWRRLFVHFFLSIADRSTVLPKRDFKEKILYFFQWLIISKNFISNMITIDERKDYSIIH